MNRRTLTTGASTAALIAAFLLPLPDFLRTLVTGGSSGGIAWGLVDIAAEVWPTLTGNQRFIMAFALAVTLPPAAYGLQVMLGYEAFTAEGLFAVAGVAFITAAGMHRGAETNERAESERAVNDRISRYLPDPPNGGKSGGV